MKGAAFKHGALIAFACGLAGAVLADGPAVTDSDRVVRNFTREAAVVGDGSIRLEVRGFNFQDRSEPALDPIGFPLQDFEERFQPSPTSDSIEYGLFELLGSYGLGEEAEVGFLLPGYVKSLRFTDAATINDGDMGDLQLYGKFKRVVAEGTSVALGLEMLVPTGSERKLFGTGEVGFNPFLSSRYTYGRLAIGAHAGYQIYSGTVPDVFNWSVQGFAKGSDTYFIRTEVSGRLFRDLGTTFNDIVVMPGIDFYVSDRIAVRPTGLAHVTDEAVDWGLGIGLAFTL